ncbi:MAG: sulfatase-like hydrolase/transferase [Planctomycetota bacterium]
MMKAAKFDFTHRRGSIARRFIITCLLPCMFLQIQPRFAPAAEECTRRPNIIIFFADQLRWSEVGGYGHPVVKTPHIDRLATEGLRFNYAFANFPTCSAARSTLLSGRHARSNGVYANQQGGAGTYRPTNRDTTLTEVLYDAGYTTALIGKWHLVPNPQALGFEKSWRAWYSPGLFKTGWSINENPDNNYTHEGYTLYHETDLADKFVRNHRDGPFFLLMSTCPPHMPLDDLPEQYKAMYNREQVALRANVWKDDKLPYDEDWFKIYLWCTQYYEHKDTFAKQVPEGYDLRDLHALYYGATTAVDDWVGRTMESLKKYGLDKNTIVIFTADHGELLGSHHLWNKNEHYDEASRIPMIVRWPAKLKPKVVDRQIISLVDLMPTLLDLCGLETPASVQGTSLAPVLLGQKETVGENLAYIETTVNEGVRTRDYTYYCTRRTYDNEHLFDNNKDPYQFKNLVKDPGYRKVLDKLRARTKAWRERTPYVKPLKVPTWTPPDEDMRFFKS